MAKKLGVLLLAAACVAIFATPAGGGRTRIKAAGSPGAWEWDPSFKHIVKGTVVIWKNPTGTAHTVTAYSQNWKKDTEIDADGGKTRKRFKKRGTYLYRCTKQPSHSSVASGECEGMCGEIHVARR